MNKRVQSKHGSKAGKGGGSSWAKPYALRSQEKQPSIATLLQQNRESFNAWCILAGKKEGGLTDAITIQRNRVAVATQKPATVSP